MAKELGVQLRAGELAGAQSASLPYRRSLSGYGESWSRVSLSIQKLHFVVSCTLLAKLINIQALLIPVSAMGTYV